MAAGLQTRNVENVAGGPWTARLQAAQIPVAAPWHHRAGSARVSAFERSRDTFRITTDTGVMDLDAIHAYLTRSYWSEGIPKPLVQKAMAGSLCFGLLDGPRQIGFARVVTDRATYAYLCDVYVLEDYQGRGLGTWFMRELMTHPDLQGLRRVGLVTRDAHRLYEKCGFTALANPDGHMEIVRPGLYLESEKA